MSASIGRDLLEEPIASLARGILDGAALAARQRGDIGPSHVRRQPEGCGGIGHEGGVLGAVGSQGVIEMGDREAPAASARGGQASGAVKESNGVGASRYGEHEHRVVGDLEDPGTGIDRGGKAIERTGAGSGGRIRTTDQGLMSPLLCH